MTVMMMELEVMMELENETSMSAALQNFRDDGRRFLAAARLLGPFVNPKKARQKMAGLLPKNGGCRQ
eukprot:1390032-Rhodomonas_salina.1